ncbi:MAG TPA: phosphoribosylformylglycinamidine synthase subunit PurL, partial [Candidatus Limnocylindrales bacterium]|nr:phosphoribosylformylglycinamidine synthase subunit PurL [Candidatus Limnocylindrales bacterium]
MMIAEPREHAPSADAVEPLHRRLGLTDEELDAVRDRLDGREPNELELAMFSVMWSEHCSYKSSKPLLRTLPTAGEGVVAGPGENAGVISIGDGLAVAFKIESHNHPSAVEPYQGAATGVGGILRDIFTMGARPIAVLDALRFGDPSDTRTRHLVDGVVRGVGGYGNCVGIPTVGGELVFDPTYQGNPLVNVMAIGVLDERRLTTAAAPGPGNLVVLFGSTTGRDGIGGASVLASATFTEDDPSKRPSVQVGDPFAEKLLIEVSLELIGRGLVEGLQDLGAGGITCAVSETADRAGTGIRVDLDAIPRREPDMAPFEVMISESQERMCAIVRSEDWDAVREVATRWGLPAAVIGRVTDDGDITVTREGAELARIPATALTSEAIVHARVARAPEHRRAAPAPGAPTGASDRLPE